MPKLNLSASLTLLGLVVLATSSSAAFSRHAKWSTSIPDYPVVRVYACADQFAAHFGEIPFGNIRTQIQSAANTWFVEGGIDLRLRYAGDLPNSDSRCSTSSPSTPSSGEIVIRAERVEGIGDGRHATYFPGFNGSDLDHGVIMMSRGTGSGANYLTHLIAQGTGYPLTLLHVDLESIFLHEFGHALGFGDTSGAGEIMSSDGKNMHNLSNEELSGLSTAAAGAHQYPPTQLRIMHRYSVSGATWSTETEPATLAATDAFGVSACGEKPSTMLGSNGIMVATLKADGGLYTFQTNGTSTSNSVHHGFVTHRPPSVACGVNPIINKTRFLIAFSERAQTDDVRVILSDNGTGWVSFDAGVTSRVAPVVTWNDPAGIFVMTLVDAHGRISVTWSENHGGSWATPRLIDGLRTFHPVGIACSPSQDECRLNWVDGLYHDNAIYTARLTINLAANPQTAAVNAHVRQPHSAYGTSAGRSDFREVFSWRDKGTATAFSSAGFATAPTLDSQQVSALVCHGNPTVAHSDFHTKWTTWFPYAARYDQ